MSQIKLFFSKFSYLVEKNPDFSLKFILPFLVFFGLMFLVGVVLPRWFRARFDKSSPYQNLSAKIQVPLLTFSLIGLLLVFFNWQMLPYLSAKILLVLLQFAVIIWFLRFCVYLFFRFPKELEVWQDEMRKQKYLRRR